jgi:ParB/RepB/Spo0J family partition protein
MTMPSASKLALLPTGVSINFKELRAHPEAEGWDLANEAEMAALRESIRVNGLINPIVLIEENGAYSIGDGRNRHAAGNAIGHQWRSTDFRVWVGSLAEFAEYADAANSHRRHETPAQKTERLRKLIAQHPELSSRRLAEKIGVSHQTVAVLRRPPPEDQRYVELVRAWTKAPWELQARFCAQFEADLDEHIRQGRKITLQAKG